MIILKPIISRIIGNLIYLMPKYDKNAIDLNQLLYNATLPFI